MKKTKEWISDYLRYFLLLLAIALLIVLIVITLKVYQRYDRTPGQDDIEILTEAQTGQVTEKETEKETEAPTESETETEKETETESADETETELQTNAASANRSTAGADGSSDSSTTTGEGDVTQTQQSGETVVQTEAQPVEIQVEEPAYTADYRTILSTCNLRSYPDYGDNVIGECYTGQTVEFLGEEEGWYKVNVDGVVGYIGPKFLG
jgi:cytoskeletal protein RodZ